MENLQRDLGRLKRLHSKSPLFEEAPKEKWSLLLVGNRGRLLRLHLGWGLAIVLLVFFIFLAIGFGLWRFSQRDWRFSQWAWMDDGGQLVLQEEINDLRRENQRLMARVAALEIVQGAPVEIFEAETVIPEILAEGLPENVDVETVDEEVVSLPAILLQESLAVEVPLQKVGLDGYVAGMREGQYRVSFNLRNFVNDTAVSGYIVSVLIPENPRLPSVASPAIIVQDGRPVEPKKGQYFSIRRFKDVRLRFGAIDARRFQSNRIFIFNEVGNLLHMEDFEVFNTP